MVARGYLCGSKITRLTQAPERGAMGLFKSDMKNHSRRIRPQAGVEFEGGKKNTKPAGI